MGKLLVKKLHPDAITPTQAHMGEDLGFDLYALEDTFLLPGKQQIVKTGISAKFIGDIPRFYFRPGYSNIEQFREKFGLKIFDRSSMAAKNGVLTMAGVIDAGYDGEIGVVMILVGPPSHLPEVQWESFRKTAAVIAPDDPHKRDEMVSNLAKSLLQGEAGLRGTVGYRISRGDKIAQMVPVQLYAGSIEVVDEHPKGTRGDAGYGSSGR